MLRKITFAVIIAATVAAVFPLSGEVSAKQRSAQDTALQQKARKACSGPMYPNGANPQINYKQGTFRCVEPQERGRS